jgi:hypothetical protein
LGWFFRKRLKLFPGVTLNFGKGGISSVRFGGRGGGITVGTGGTRASASIPGTGLGYRTRLDQPGSSAADMRATERAVAEQREAKEAAIVALNKVAEGLLYADQQKHEVVKLTPREREFLSDMSVADYRPSPAQTDWIKRITEAVQQRLRKASA